MIKDVLTGMPVYWMDLVPIPKSILDKLRKLIFFFFMGFFCREEKVPLGGLVVSLSIYFLWRLGYKAFGLV